MIANAKAMRELSRYHSGIPSIKDEVVRINDRYRSQSEGLLSSIKTSSPSDGDRYSTLGSSFWARRVGLPSAKLLARRGNVSRPIFICYSS